MTGAVGRWRRALDPVEVLTEMTSGLTITLVVLLTAGVVLDEAARPARVLVALGVGSTLASGLAAGILNALEDLHEAGDRRTLRRRLRSASRHEARSLVEQRIEDDLGTDVDPAAVEPVIEAIVADVSPGSTSSAALGWEVSEVSVRPGWGSLRTVVVSVGLNVLALLPAALPFALIDDWHTAWRWSAIAVAVALVVVGSLWGRAIGINPLACGVVLVSIGAIEIAVGFALEAL